MSFFIEIKKTEENFDETQEPNSEATLETEDAQKELADDSEVEPSEDINQIEAIETQEDMANGSGDSSWDLLAWLGESYTFNKNIFLPKYIL